MQFFWTLAVVLLCGCATQGPMSGGPTGAVSDTPPLATGHDAGGGAGAGACASGTGPLFLASSYGGGFVPEGQQPRLVEIAHNGTIAILQGFTREGHGTIVENEPGALHDLTVDAARAMLSRRSISLEGRDFVATRGDMAQLPAGLYASFCDHVVSALPKMRDNYPNTQGCADQGAYRWDVSVESATRTIVVDDCAGDAAEFRKLQREFETLVGPG